MTMKLATIDVASSSISTTFKIHCSTCDHGRQHSLGDGHANQGSGHLETGFKLVLFVQETERLSGSKVTQTQPQSGSASGPTIWG
jgi:hypothetical protein